MTFPLVMHLHQRAATGDASMVVHILVMAIIQAATAKILITAAVVNRVSSLFIFVYFIYL